MSIIILQKRDEVVSLVRRRLVEYHVGARDFDRIGSYRWVAGGDYEGQGQNPPRGHCVAVILNDDGITTRIEYPSCLLYAYSICQDFSQ